MSFLTFRFTARPSLTYRGWAWAWACALWKFNLQGKVAGFSNCGTLWNFDACCDVNAEKKHFKSSMPVYSCSCKHISRIRTNHAAVKWGC
jgi:hypothetical protein